MRHRLRIEAAERGTADGGGATLTWQPVATVWAEISPASGREVVVADGLSVRVTHEVRLRYRADLASEMRFTSGARVLDIRVVRDVDGRKRWLSCLCEETLP